MHLIVVTRDVPEAARYGGMREILARYDHAAALGHTVRYVGFAHDAAPGRHLPRRSFATALAHMATGEPLQVALRAPTLPAMDRMVAQLRAESRDHDATIVIAEQFLTLGVAAELAGELHAPLVHRTHNDEFRYARYVASCERRPARRAVLEAEARLVRRHVRRWTGCPQLRAVLHISAASHAAWLAAGAHAADALQFVVPPALPAEPVDPNRLGNPVRVVYVGSLDVPQNGFELERFLNTAWPRLRRSAGLELRIAGRAADKFARALGADLDGIQVVADFDQPAAVLAGCDLALNPAVGGSGVSIKTVEYLAHGLPVVTTPAGLRGLDVPTRFAYVGNDLGAALDAAIADRPGHAQRRRDLVDWYQQNLSPQAVLDPVWPRLELIAEKGTGR